MSEWSQRIREAQRRLWFIRWLGKLGWSVALAAGAFAVFIAIERLLVAADQEPRLLLWVAAGLSCAAGLGSLLWTFLTRETAPIAAARLDQAAHLQERLSTALFFDQSADPFAKAAVADAQQVSRGITPSMYLPVLAPRSASYAGGAFAAAVLFCWLFPVVDLSGQQAARQVAQARREQLQRTTAQVKPVVDKIRSLQAKHPELKTATQPADPLEMAKLDAPNDMRRDALKQINAVANKLDERKSRPELAKVEDFKQMLRRLAAQPSPTSSVGELSKALANGDFKAAKDSLDSIRKELGKPPTTPEDRAKSEQVRADLKKLADQVGKIAESNSKLKEQLQQINLSQEDINKLLEKVDKGKLDELAKELASKGLTPEQVNKLVKQAAKSAEAKKEASKLAQQLAKAAAQKQQQAQSGDKSQDGNQQAQGNQQGQSKSGQQDSQAGGQPQGGQSDPGDGLSQAAEQLSDLESLQQEMADLNSSLADLQNLKDGMDQGDPGDGGNPEQQAGGMGQLGQGSGGVAPKNETAFGTAPQRTRVHTTSGAIIDMRFVEGEQYKGEVSDHFVEAVLGARGELTDAARQKPQPRHLKLREAEYFKHVEADLPKDKVDAAKQKLEAQPSPPQQ